MEQASQFVGMRLFERQWIGQHVFEHARLLAGCSQICLPHIGSVAFREKKTRFAEYVCAFCRGARGLQVMQKVREVRAHVGDLGRAGALLERLTLQARSHVESERLPGTVDVTVERID